MSINKRLATVKTGEFGIDGSLALKKEENSLVKTMLLNTADLSSGQKYQRKIDMKKVATIISNFNKHKFGIIKVSFRDGIYYVYDGQHRVVAIKALNGGKDCFIECEVHYGLTYEDEAKLFAEQYDGATQVDIVYKWKAMYEGKMEPVFDIVNSCRTIGIDVSFTKAKADNRITCLGELQKMWNKLKKDDTLIVLNMIKKTWGGDMNSFNRPIIGGMKEFYTIYKDEIDVKTFISQMKKIEPVKIEAVGNVDVFSKGDLKYAKVIWDYYNKNLKRNRLDYKFKG